MTDSRNIYDDEQPRRRPRTNSYSDLDQYAAGAGNVSGSSANRNHYARGANDNSRYATRSSERAGERPVRNRYNAVRSDARQSSRRQDAYRTYDSFDDEWPSSGCSSNGSVYRPTRNRSRYDRSSNRYTSENAENRREGRREVRSNRVQPEQQRANATRYSRDRYVRSEGQSHVMPVSQQSYAAANRAKPVNPKILAILGAVAALLLVVIVARFMVFGTTSAEYGEIRSQIDAQQTQLKELEASGNEAQTQMDTWQQTIDIYNKSKK